MSSAPEAKPSSLGVDDIVVPPVPAAPEDQIALYTALEATRLNNELLKQFLEGRGHWDKRIFVIMAGWLIAVIVCIACQGLRLFGFHLSDGVLIAFITTTTINVIGLGYIVAKYFFTPKS